ncbi:hypothetical protein [Nocardia farcinica]|uniref:hypothetical protein n=1 Tax=Nocardia farcinica TaxID=37329 RepID=UPI002455857C|nr:hypothetical protein [Nocardia farcinica]
MTIVVQPRLGQQAPEVKVYPADESGASASRQLHRRVGSFTPDEPIDVEGCYGFALLLLGGYVEGEQ